jgi:hypothetical protein
VARKSSVGVTIFGFVFLLMGLWGMLRLAIHIQMSIAMGIFLTKSLLSNIRIWFLPLIQALFLVSSFALFKKTNWAPIWTIILAILQGACYIYWLPIMLKAESNFESITLKVLIIDALSMLIIIGFQAYIIYFFTRPKVKEQFK